MKKSPTAEEVIEQLGLKPLPAEGGWYLESYRAGEVLDKEALPARYGGNRVFSTGIYYLLKSGERSLLHRLKSDEMWHFYGGAPLHLVEIAPDGGVHESRLGFDLAAGERPQHTVKSGTWFGATPAEKHSFTLVGCTVAPGFEFADLEFGARKDLLARFPAASAVVVAFTSDDEP